MYKRNQARNIKDKLMGKKISPNVPSRIRILERQCFKKLTYTNNIALEKEL